MTSKEILVFINSIINKKFDTKNKGYDPEQVDQTIDAIFENFKSYINAIDEKTKRINNLEEDNKSLKREIDELKKSNQYLQSNLNKLESSGISLDMINKRLNNMEKEISSSSRKSVTKSTDVETTKKVGTRKISETKKV